MISSARVRPRARCSASTSSWNRKYCMYSLGMRPNIRNRRTIRRSASVSSSSRARVSSRAHTDTVRSCPSIETPRVNVMWFVPQVSSSIERGSHPMSRPRNRRSPSV